MTFSDAIDEALDKREREGGVSVEIEADRARAEARVSDVDRLGVKVGRVAVRKARAVDLAREVDELPGRLRSLPERVVPVEVDAAGGRAVLRTDPCDMRRREFFEVRVRGAREIDLRRFRVREGGERERVEWTMSRDQLGRLLDELAREPEDADGR